MLIQIGVTAARNPDTGEFLPAVPIFREAAPELEASEAAAIKDIGKVFAEKFKQYKEGKA